MNRHIQCRICASTDASLDLVNIFDDYETEECIANILLELAGIKATVDDGFPRHCCTQCHSDLTSAVSVRRKCIESEKLFQEALNCSSSIFDGKPDNESMVSFEQEQYPIYRCYECSIDFYSSESLKQHYESKHANAIYGWKSFGISEISMFDTTDDEAVETRLTPKENPIQKSHRCCGCLLLFDSVTELKQHSQTVHAPNAMELSEYKPFRCEICYHTYTTRQGVITHQMKRRTMAYLCSFCGVLYGSKFELGYHENKHYDHTFDCDICGRKFFKLNYLNKHKESVHLAPELRQKHVCNICGSSVKTAEYLKIHMKLHSNEEPFSCNLCGARFKLYRYLSWHMKIHKGLHKCEECDATFKGPAELQDHMNRHFRSSNISCNLCGKRFYTKRDHRTHMRLQHDQFKRRKVMIKKTAIKRQKRVNVNTENT